MCVGVQNRLRRRTGDKQQRYPGDRQGFALHGFVEPFGDPRFKQVRTNSALAPLMATRLCRPPVPDVICTDVAGIDNWQAKNRISSSLAAPSTGGAATRILIASPWIPIRSATEAFGWI